MAVKLYNRTRLPNELLSRLMSRAAQRVGARSGVVVIVNRKRGYSTHCSGHAHECFAMWESGLRRIKRGRGRLIGTDGGTVTVSIPDCARTDKEALHSAHDIVSVALHEFSHIRDFQEHASDRHSKRGANGRRPAWEDRPEEQRAQYREVDARSRQTNRDDDLELELAEALRANKATGRLAKFWEALDGRDAKLKAED